MLFEIYLQFIFLEPVGFPHQSFYAVPVYRLLKIPAANANACLQSCLLILRQPYHVKRKVRKPVAPGKQLFDGFAAFQLICFPVKISLGGCQLF